MELRGVGVSPGIAVGEALLFERATTPLVRLLLPAAEVESEVARLRRAVGASREQLQRIRERLTREGDNPHGYIFDAQLLMLDDPLLLDRTLSVIREQHLNAAWALRAVSERLQALFDDFSDAYLRERRTDLDDVLGRIELNLAGAADAPSLFRLPRPHVIVAAELAPSEAAQLDWANVLAVISEAGSASSHTTILARSRGVPAVVGLPDATRLIPAGALVVVDGSSGRVELEPSPPALVGYRAAQEEERVEETRLLATRSLLAVTRDGVAVRLQANAEFPEEASAALRYGAEGIGLFRSEYLLGRGQHWPSEERQVEVYRALLRAVHPHPVTIRTWDVGREDLAPGGPTSPNPALGERALRLLARDPAPFVTQVRAILRAGLAGPLRLMFPFIGGPSDLLAARALVRQARDDLRQRGIAFNETLPIGVTIELPSAVLTVDLLAREADFFSVGTNDLIQYLLAVDREDPRVASLYAPLHPAVVRALKRVADAAAATGRPLAVCGEMAAEPLQALLLVGLGVRELSMSPGAIPKVKNALRSATTVAARAAAESCLRLATAAEIAAVLEQTFTFATRAGAGVGG